jgi:hypothetical protein
MTLAQGISAKSWKTKARSGPGPLTSRPSTKTWPALAGIRPAMILRSVVLPQPDGPSRVVSLPSGKSSEMPLSASMPPA